MKTEHFNIKADSKNDKYLNNTKITELICYMSYEYDMKHELYRYVFLQMRPVNVISWIEIHGWLNLFLMLLKNAFIIV